MMMIRKLVAGCFVLGLAACATTEPATRGASLDPTAPQAVSEAALAEAAVQMVVPDYDVVAININVPQNLRVSEANVFFPIADIVWHGDPLGDRHVQVKAIYEEAFATGTASLKGGRAVTVQATITRFHALTPKARYTTGGNHSMHFILTVYDAATGEIIDGPRPVVADVAASGGQRAMEEEDVGLTQKVVIEQRLAEVILAELTAPVAVAAPEVEAVSRQDFSPMDLNIVE
jgi:hypothetical protein